MNQVVLIGRLAADPEVRQTQSGISQCSMRLAVQRNYAGKDGKREADFINIVAWRQTADFCGRYFHKGSKIALVGSLQTRSYEAQDGSKRYITEVIAESVEFCESKTTVTQEGATPPKTDANGFTEVDDDELPF